MTAPLSGSSSAFRAIGSSSAGESDSKSRSSRSAAASAAAGPYIPAKATVAAAAGGGEEIRATTPVTPQPPKKRKALLLSSPPSSSVKNEPAAEDDNPRELKKRRLDKLIVEANKVFAAAIESEEENRKHAEDLSEHTNAKAILKNVSAIEANVLNDKQREILEQFKETFTAAALAPPPLKVVDEKLIKEKEDQLAEIVRKMFHQKQIKDCIRVLTEAVRGKRVALVEELLKTGLKLTEDNEETYKCLMAVAYSTPQIALLILATNPLLVFENFRTENLHFRLYKLAIRTENVDLGRVLVARGVNSSAVEVTNEKTSIPVCCQAAMKSLEITKLLIEDASLINRLGLRMLLKALRFARVDIADAIREKMINFNFSSNDEVTKVFVDAIDNTQTDAIAFLMRSRAQNAETLMVAIDRIAENGDAMEVLANDMIQRGVSPSDALWIYVEQNPCLDVNEETFELKFTPAVRKTIKLFIRLGADINALKDGETILAFLLARAFDQSINDLRGRIIEWRIAILKAIQWFIGKGADLTLKGDEGFCAFEIAVQLANSKNVVPKMLNPLLLSIKGNQEALDSGLVMLIRRTFYDGGNHLIKKGARPQVALNRLSSTYAFDDLVGGIIPAGVRCLIENGAKAFFDETDDGLPPVLESCFRGFFYNVTVLTSTSLGKDRKFWCKDRNGLGLLTYRALAVLTCREADLESNLYIFKMIAAEIAKIPANKINNKDILAAYILLKWKGINIDEYIAPSCIRKGSLNYNALSDAHTALQELVRQYLYDKAIEANQTLETLDAVHDSFNGICTEFESDLFVVRTDHFINKAQNTLLMGLTEDQRKTIASIKYDEELLHLSQQFKSKLISGRFNRLTHDFMYLYDQLPEGKKKEYNAAGISQQFWKYYLEIYSSVHQEQVKNVIEQAYANPNSEFIKDLPYEDKVKALFNLIQGTFPEGIRAEVLKVVRTFVIDEMAKEISSLLQFCTTFFTKDNRKQILAMLYRERFAHVFELAQGYYHRKALNRLFENIKMRVDYTGVSGVPKNFTKDEAAQATNWEKEARAKTSVAGYLEHLQKSLTEASDEKLKDFLTCQIQKENFYLKLEQYLRILVFAIKSMPQPAAASSLNSASSLLEEAAVNLFDQIKEFMEVCASGWTDVLARLAEAFLRDIKRKNLEADVKQSASVARPIESQEMGLKEREEKHHHESSGSNSEAEKQLVLNLGIDRRDIFRVWAKHWRDHANNSRQEQLRLAGFPPEPFANLGSEVHFDFAAVQKHGARFGIPDSDGVVEDIEKWTEEMEKHFQGFFSKEYLTVSTLINRVTKWINSNRALKELFENAFKQKFLSEWRTEYYQEILEDIKLLVDAVLNKIQSDYSRIIKEQLSKEALDKQLEDVVVKPLHAATTNSFGIVFDIVSIRSQVLLRKDLNVLKANLHNIIAQAVLKEKKLAYVAAGCVYSPEDGLIHRWLVRKFLLSVKVLGLPEIRGLVPVEAAAAPAVPAGRIVVRGMPPRQPQALAQPNAALAVLAAAGGNDVRGMPPRQQQLALPNAGIPQPILPAAPPNAAGAELMRDL
jgi:hypothetical protein